jgi:Bacterial mobilisation protein (MobC)
MEGAQKLNGRPRLKSGKRIKKIDTRFTEDEYKLVEDLEKALGVSKTELVRMRLLNNADQVVINAKSLINALDAIGAEMGRIGNNINQLAKHANILKLQGELSPITVTKFNTLLESYIGVQQALETALRKVIRATGK